MSGIRSAHRPVLHLLLALLSGAGFAKAETAFDGSVEFTAGRMEHPLGVRAEPSTPFASADLLLQCSLGSPISQWRLSYESSLNRFDPDVALDFLRHSIGAEWIRGAARDAVTWSVGAQLATRTNDSFYTPYDHRQGFAYVGLKGYPTDQLLMNGFVGLRAREYPDLPEESYLEPHAVLIARRFFDTGTSLGTTLRAGGKWYNDSVARNVWDSADVPTTSQLSASLDLTHSLTQRIGLRGSYQYRWEISAFPHFVQEDIYDSPLLDRYASAGSSANASLKVLTPAQLWVELAYAWWEDDYGETVFADGDVWSARYDRSSNLSLSLKRQFLQNRRGLTLHAALVHHDRRSAVQSYDWSGWTSLAGLRWDW